MVIDCFNPGSGEHFVTERYENPPLAEMARRYAELQEEYVQLEIQCNRYLEDYNSISGDA